MKRTISLAGATLATVAALGLAALGLAACSGKAPQPPSADTETMKKFAVCMQQYGIDIPAPDEGEPPGGLVTLSTSDPKALAARTACARYAPAAHKQGRLDPAEEERALKLAECLRMEGIKARDPEAGGVEVTIQDGVTYTRQQLVDAYTTCNKQVPAVTG
jgi:hypothetical protein